MPTSDDSLSELWELAEFCAREALLLRSFLEYLRTSPDSADKKLARLQQWRAEIGIQLGNPGVTDQASLLFESARARPPQERQQILREALEKMAASYFFSK